ncbi:MAG: PAS domain S-box-containing protein [Motiliproteus sp.]|jgi:PAS domain S-box-containing protein
MKGLIKTNSFIFITYLLSAGLGSLLAFSSEQVFAVWPAAGVALAGVLLYGYGAAVAIFMARVLFDVSMGVHWDVALLLGLSATLQAVAGAYLLRQLAGFPNPLLRLAEVLSFLFWGCLVGTLISASWGIATLWFAGHISTEQLLFSWTTWWAGDAIGVLFITPILLAWLSPAVREWRQRRWPLTLSLSLVLLVLVGCVGAIRYWEGLRINDQFAHEGEVQQRQLTDLRDEQVSVLRSLSSLFKASLEVSRDSFRVYVGPLLAQHPELQALSWSPLVTESGRVQFETRMQQQGFAGYQITERGKQGAVRIAARRAEYAPVAFIEPMSNNLRALGYDLCSSPAHKRVLTLAQETGKISAGAVITLAEDERAGLVLSLPVETRTMEGLEADRQGGFVVSVLRLGYALEQILDAQITAGIHYRLLDVTDPDQVVMIRASGSAPQSSYPLHQGLAQQIVNPVLDQRLEVEFAGRAWILERVADGRFLAAKRQSLGWMLLFSGQAVAGLVGLIVFLMIGRHEKTRVLLAGEAVAIHQREDRLSLAQFALDHMAMGVYLIDKQGRFVYVNRAACAALDYSADEMLGLSLGDIDPGVIEERLPVYWARLKQETLLKFQTTHLSKHGHPLRVDVVTNYVESSEGGLNLAFMCDISQRNAQESQLRKLAAAIEQVPVSVLITDLDGTIEYVNSVLLRTSGYVREEVLGHNSRLFRSNQTGASVFTAMWRVLSSGGVWYGELCSRCKDGSLIWESVSITPILDDGVVPSHYLAVKENITASRGIRKRLDQSEKRLNHAQRLAHVGSWELDFGTSSLSWSNETCRIFGLAAGSSLDYQQYLGFVHPNDQERLDEAWLSALEGGIYDIEHRIIVNKTIKSIRQRATFEVDAQGKVLRGIGTIQDVTELARASARLLESENRYRSLVMSLSVGVLLRDASGRIDMHNPAATQILGEVLQVMQRQGPGQGGVHVYAENGEPLLASQYPSILTLTNGEPRRNQVVGVDRLEGGRVWLNVNTEPLSHDDQRLPHAVIISFEDITRRSQAEHDLKLLRSTETVTHKV